MPLKAFRLLQIGKNSLRKSHCMTDFVSSYLNALINIFWPRQWYRIKKKILGQSNWSWHEHEMLNQTKLMLLTTFLSSTSILHFYSNTRLNLWSIFQFWYLIFSVKTNTSKYFSGNVFSLCVQIIREIEVTDFPWKWIVDFFVK